MRSLLRAVAVIGLSPLLLAAPQQPSRTHLVIIVDGLRPDYVTLELMPRLARIGQRGVVFNAHHSIFPTVTRVNAASLVTGAYPRTHGLLGNTIYLPRAAAARTLDTGQRADLELVVRGEGRLLTAPTLGELLHAAGRKLMVVSSGSSGSAWILNQAEPSGVIVHYDYVQPASLAPRVTAVLGPPPPTAIPDDKRNGYAVDAYLKLGVDELRPDVTFMWLRDPDGTAHAHGVATPLTRTALGLVDAQIGRLEDGLRARGMLERTNIIVTSDHGFSTHTGELRLAELVRPFARPLPTGEPDLVVAEGAIHFRSPADPARVADIVSALQKRPEVGAIFTRDQTTPHAEGVVPGTLSFDIARWNHPTRSGDILVSANWTQQRNEAGFGGTTTSGGVAGHGSSSLYDIRNTLLAAGPDFREAARSALPTSNADVAPTVLRLLGMPVPPSMAGRVIEEGLRTGAAAGGGMATTSVTVRNADGSYELTAYFSLFGGRRYLDYTDVKRR